MVEEFGNDEGVGVMKEEKNDDDDDVNRTAAEGKAHFVLIHGIGGGAWCWYKLRCLLENCGYKVSCLDLKGSGVDLTDPNDVLTFNDYNQPLLHFLSSLTENDKVWLIYVLTVFSYSKFCSYFLTIFSSFFPNLCI